MIEQDTIDDVAVVRLAHGKVNALDLELLAAITDTFVELDAGRARAIVLTGAGPIFSAGVDLWRILDGGDGYISVFLPALSEAFETVFATGRPVVAAVNGHAIAGGCIFASCADRRLMADGDGRIGVTELIAGVPFPPSALEIFTYAVGPRVARELVVTGATLTATPALDRGLVDEVTTPDELLDRAVAAARQLADRVPADTFRFTKRQLRLATSQRIAERRPVDDPLVREMWIARVADGWLRAYLERVTRRG